MEPKGKVALVTGGARRLGREQALALARAGVDVAVNYLRSATEAAAVVREIEALGVRVSYVMPGSVATEFGPGGQEDWKIQPEDVAQIVLDLLAFPERTLPSRVEVRPSRPPRRG